MKRVAFVIVLLLVAFLLFSCVPLPIDSNIETSDIRDTKESSKKDTTDQVDTFADETEKEVIDETSNLETENVFLGFLPISEDGMEFLFASGVGAWGTYLVLYPDGTFEGSYHDSNMGDVGEGNPKGSVYICNFSGRFEIIEKLDEYSYKLKLTELRTKKEKGEEWIEDGIRYISSHPYGITEWSYDSATGDKTLVQGEDFIFYLPDTPLEGLSETFLSWWPYSFQFYIENSDITTLQHYGILNVITEQGFFSTDDM